MKLTSQAMPNSEGFKANEAAHLEALAQVQEAAEAAALGGGERSRERGAENQHPAAVAGALARFAPLEVHEGCRVGWGEKRKPLDQAPRPTQRAKACHRPRFETIGSLVLQTTRAIPAHRHRPPGWPVAWIHPR